MSIAKISKGCGQNRFVRRVKTQWLAGQGPIVEISQTRMDILGHVQVIGLSSRHVAIPPSHVSSVLGNCCCDGKPGNGP